MSEIPIGYCQCGCGQRTPLSTITSARLGYVKGVTPTRYIQSHTRRGKPHANAYRQVPIESTRRNGWLFEHLVIAERVLGRPLPAGVQVHHVDENRRNNAHANLVICQDQKYHQLLHVRTRVLKAGGNPNTDALCSRCKQAKPFSEFSVRSGSTSTGRQSACKPCMATYWDEYRKAKELAARKQSRAA